MRTRVEDTLSASGNPWRARLRLEYRRVTEDWGLVSYLYSNDEVFCRFSDDEFWRNRFQAGCNLLFSKYTDLSCTTNARTVDIRLRERSMYWDRSQWSRLSRVDERLTHAQARNY